MFATAVVVVLFLTVGRRALAGAARSLVTAPVVAGQADRYGELAGGRQT